MEGKSNSYRILVGEPEETTRKTYVDLGRRIILKWFLEM
jgi:hypothetical protein